MQGHQGEWSASPHRVGVPLETEQYTGNDPLGYVLSTNLHRRHLSESQRAMVAAKVAAWQLGQNQHTGGSANLLPRPTRHNC